MHVWCLRIRFCTYVCECVYILHVWEGQRRALSVFLVGFPPDLQRQGFSLTPELTSTISQAKHLTPGTSNTPTPTPILCLPPACSISVDAGDLNLGLHTCSQTLPTEPSLQLLESRLLTVLQFFPSLQSWTPNSQHTIPGLASSTSLQHHFSKTQLSWG